MALADRFLAPLISSNVNEYADQPCLLIWECKRDGFRGTSRLKECFLNKVQGIIGRRDEASGEAVQPVYVRLEEAGQSAGVLRRLGRRNSRGRPFAHTLLNV
jgi:hypothetical protein